MTPIIFLNAYVRDFLSSVSDSFRDIAAWYYKHNILKYEMPTKF